MEVEGGRTDFVLISDSRCQKYLLLATLFAHANNYVTWNFLELLLSSDVIVISYFQFYFQFYFQPLQLVVFLTAILLLHTPYYIHPGGDTVCLKEFQTGRLVPVPAGSKLFEAYSIFQVLHWWFI